ncbi:MAG TPA: response regulator transcription factor [Candidatus Acidoferrales bacterium]|jgi:two-component system response regulator DegU|nr:response regulator transcription factor [Candidatus Acidoferrales bacterium]
MACPNISAKSIEASVFLATENRLLRDTLARLLRKQTGIRVAGAVANTENISGQILESECDMVLTDFSPASSSSLPLRNLHEENSQLKIILIGMEDDPETFLKAIHLGASGYVLKDASALEIVAAIRRVGRGEAVCPPNLCMVLIEYVWSEERRNLQVTRLAKANNSRLTHRQVQLMNLVADGLSNKEIATSLNLSQFTVKNHLRRVMRQVEATNRYDAVELIRASGLLGVRRSTAPTE